LQTPEQRSGPQYLGLTIHHSLEALNKKQVEPTSEALTNHFNNAWINQDAWDGFTPWDLISWGRKSFESMEQQAKLTHRHGYKLLQLYLEEGQHQKNIPATFDKEPLAEFQLTIPLDQYGGKHFQELVSILDLVTLDGRLLDYKTKNNFTKMKLADFDGNLQPLLYAFGLTEMGIVDPPIPFRYGQLIYGGKAKPNPRDLYDQGYAYDESVGGSISAERIDVFRQLILPGYVERAEIAIDMLFNSSDPFQTAVKHLRQCSSCRYCSFRSQCPLFAS